MTEQELAQSTLDELKAERQRILDLKGQQADRLLFLESPAGKRELARRQRGLDETMARYVAIKTEGPAEQVVRDLIEIQVTERILRADVRLFSEAEKMQEMLDDKLALCNKAIVSKEAAAKSRR